MLPLKEKTLSVMTASEFQFNPNITGLSARHMQILDLLVKKFSYKLMASQLNITINTLQAHLRNIFRIMRVKNRGEAIAKIVGIDSAAPGTVGNLRPQEKRVLELLANGLGIQSISEHLKISTHTVRTHLKSIYLALRVDGHNAAVEKFRLHEQQVLSNIQSVAPTNRNFSRITDQDKKILQLLSDKVSREEIAKLIGVTQGTLKNYISKIYKALGVENEEDALDVGLRQKDPTYDIFVKLRSRERDVLSLLAKGETTENIARALSIKPGTVLVYYSSIRRSFRTNTMEDTIELYKKLFYAAASSRKVAPSRSQGHSVLP